MTALYFINGAPLHCPTLERYWCNPAPFEAEAAHRRRIANAAIDAGMARSRAAQAARWAAEEQGDAL